MNRKLCAVGALLLCAAGCSKESQAPEAEPKPVVSVKVGKVETRDITVAVTGPATIFAREMASIAARVTAPIRTLRVQKGANVQAGQSLATLDHGDLDAQRQDAVAQIADAQATLERTQSGTVPADLDQKRGAVELAEAALNQAQKNADRRTQLFQEGAIPQRDLLQAQTDLAQAKTTHTVAQRALELAQSQTSEREIRSAQARLDSARAKLALVDAQLQFTEIRAPFAGTLSEQFLFPGDMADATKPIFQIMDLSVVIARAQVPESDATGVRQGQTCVFTPVDTGLGTFTGSVTVVNRSVDPQRRTLEIWCQIDNASRKLQGNVFGDLRIILQRIPNAVVVPVTAVEFQTGTPSKGSVLVVDESSVAHRQEIEAGETSDGFVHIRSGLKPGDTVVIEGGYALPDGTAVKVGEAEKEAGKEAK